MYITTGHICTFNHMIIAIRTMKISLNSPTFKKNTHRHPHHRSELLALQFRRSHQINLQTLKDRIREVERRRREGTVHPVNRTPLLQNVVRSVQDRLIDPLRSLIYSGLVKSVQLVKETFRNLAPQPPSSEILELIDDWKPSAATAVTSITEEPETPCHSTPKPTRSRTLTGYDKEGKYREIHKILYGPLIPYNLLQLTPPYSQEEETSSDSDDSAVIDQESLIYDNSSLNSTRLSYSRSDSDWDVAIPEPQAVRSETPGSRSNSALSSEPQSFDKTVFSLDSELDAIWSNPRFQPTNPDYDRHNCQCAHSGHQPHSHRPQSVHRVRIRNHFRHLEKLKQEAFLLSREQIPIWERPTYHTGSPVSSTSSTD